MADGGPVLQGTPGWLGNLTQTPTQLTNGAAAAGDGTGLYLFSGTVGVGLYVVGRERPGVQSFSYAGDGVSAVALPGSQAGVGVRGHSTAPEGAGVYGSHRERIGVWGEAPIGVVGRTSSDFGIGVEADASGPGVIGVFAAANGRRCVGLYAFAPPSDGAALQVNGRAVFSSSGRIVVPAGATSAVQGGLTLSTAAFVLATLQQDLPNVSVRAAVPDPAAGTVTVHLDQAAAVDAVVGWMAVNRCASPRTFRTSSDRSSPIRRTRRGSPRLNPRSPGRRDHFSPSPRPIPALPCPTRQRGQGHGTRAEECG